MSKLDEIEMWIKKAERAYDISPKEYSDIGLLIRAVRQLGTALKDMYPPLSIRASIDADIMELIEHE